MGTLQIISFATSVPTIIELQIDPVVGTRAVENVLDNVFRNTQMEVIIVNGVRVTEVYVVVYLNNKDSVKVIRKGINITKKNQMLKCSNAQIFKCSSVYYNV